MTRPSRDLATIGGRFRAERRRLRLSQAQAAELCGVSVDTVGSWESANTSPTAVALAAFARAGADVQFIITGQRIAIELLLAGDRVGDALLQRMGNLSACDRLALIELLAKALAA